MLFGQETPTGLSETIDYLMNQGVAVAILIVIILGGVYVLKKVFGKGGYAERILDAALAHLKREEESRSSLDTRIVAHCDEEELHSLKMRRAVIKCIGAAIGAMDGLQLPDEDRERLKIKLSEAKTELANGGFQSE